MASDFYVNVSGKRVLYSSLDPSLQQRLRESGTAESEATRQRLESVDTEKSYAQQRDEFYEKDHIITRKTGEKVSVPGRYVTKATKGKVKAPDRKIIRAAKQRKEQIERTKQKIQKIEEYDVAVRTGSEKGKKKFENLSPKKQAQVLKKASPIELAKMGYLAPKDNVHFKVRVRETAPIGGNVSYSRVYSSKLHDSYNRYVKTGDPSAINIILAETYRTEGARAASKLRTKFIKAGVKGTSLEFARQGASVGRRSQSILREAEQRRSAQILKTGQQQLQQEKYGALIKGELGATFDDRIAPLVTRETVGSYVGFAPDGSPYQGAPKPTWIVDGKEFKTREEAEKYAQANQRETGETVLIPTLIPSTERPISGSPKLPLARGIEEAEKSLTQFAIDRQKELKKLGLSGTIVSALDPTAVPVEVGRIGLQTIASIENTKEQYLAPLFGAKPADPITFKKTTSDEVVFPVKITDKGIQLKTSDEIIQQTRKFVDTFGGSAFIGGVTASYGIGGTGVVKSVASKVVSKFKGLITQESKIPVIVSKQPKVYPEIRSQAPLTEKQVAQAQDIMKRIETRQQLAERLSQPTILDPRKTVSLKPSQKDVRIFAEKPKNVQPDPTYKPLLDKQALFPKERVLAEQGDFIGARPRETPIKKAFGKEVVVGEIVTPIKEFKYKPLREPNLLTKSEFGEKKFREFIKTTEPGTFSYQPTSIGLGFGAGGIIKGTKTGVTTFTRKKVPRITYERAEQEFRDFQNLIGKPVGETVGKSGKKYQTSLRGKDFTETKLTGTSEDFGFLLKKGEKSKKVLEDIDLGKRDQVPLDVLRSKAKPVEYDALTQKRGMPVPMKRPGSKPSHKYKIKSKVDESALLPKDVGDPLIKSTKISLGKSIIAPTKTLAKKKSDDYLKDLLKGSTKRGKTRKFDEPKVDPKDKLVGSGTSVTILKAPETKQIVKPQTKTITEPPKKKTTAKIITKSKSPIQITIQKESKAKVPKTKGSPIISLWKPTPSKKRKQKQRLSTSTIPISSAVVTEEILLSKDRPQLKSKTKTDTIIISSLKSDSKLKPALGTKEKQKFGSKLIPKSKTQAKLKPLLGQKTKQLPKQKTQVITKPKIKTKTRQKVKTVLRSKDRYPSITTPKLKITPKEAPKITPKITPVTEPPKVPTLLVPPGVPSAPKPRKKEYRRKKKGARPEDFYGSTHESDVFGWRSKKADITYNPKKIAKILGNELKLRKKSTIGGRKSPRRTKLPNTTERTLTGKLKVKLI